MAFRRAMHREYPRTIAGETWTEIVPFSFSGLYDIAPDARRVEAEIPFDPYELSAWPVRTVDRRSEVRYQFQTRNLELVDLVRLLARATPRLTFTLTTLCLDDSSIESYRFSGRAEKTWLLPDDRRNFHWERARKRFRLVGDEVYDDHEAERWAEEEMLAEAFSHWDESGRVRKSRPPTRYRWWNAVRLRDLETERKLSLLEGAFMLGDSNAERSSRGVRGESVVSHPRRRSQPRARRRA